MFYFCNINILGAWNTSIINPFWLAEQLPDVFEKKTETPAEIKIAPIPTYKYTIQDVQIETSSERLIISTSKNNNKQRNLIKTISSSIIEKLPHTPIIAVGHNFKYKIKAEKFLCLDTFFDKDKNNNVFKRLDLEEQIEQQNNYAFPFENHVLNLNLRNTNDEIIVSLNYHYKIDNPKKTKTAIDEFLVNYSDSKKKYSLLEKVTK